MRRVRPTAWVLLTATLATAAIAQVKFTRKYLPGKERVTSTLKMTQVFTKEGTEYPTSGETTTVTTCLIFPPEGDGKFRIEHTTESHKVRGSFAPGVTLEFDSTKPEATKISDPGLQPLIDLYKAVSGITYTMVYDGDGHVIAVEGLEEAIARAGSAKDLLRGQLNRERVLSEVNKPLSLLPTEPVKPGARWQREDTIPTTGAQSLPITAEYEYEGTVEKAGKTLDKIGIRFTNVKPPVNEEGRPKVLRSNLKVESSSGTALVDRTVGIITESSSTVRVVGTLTLSENEKEVPAKVDLTVEQSLVVTR